LVIPPGCRLIARLVVVIFARLGVSTDIMIRTARSSLGAPLIGDTGCINGFLSPV